MNNVPIFNLSIYSYGTANNFLSHPVQLIQNSDNFDRIAVLIRHLTIIMNCLLIDDDLDDQEIFCMALREVNPEIQCMIAQDGQEGLKKLQLLDGQIHDFIFVDLNMPRMNGMETLTEIKKMSFLKESKIYVYSTTSNKKIIDEAIEKGAHGFLVKPSRIMDLQEELKKIFQG